MCRPRFGTRHIHVNEVTGSIINLIVIRLETLVDTFNIPFIREFAVLGSLGSVINIGKSNRSRTANRGPSVGPVTYSSSGLSRVQVLCIVLSYATSGDSE
jgi:hypothetical protein